MASHCEPLMMKSPRPCLFPLGAQRSFQNLARKEEASMNATLASREGGALPPLHRRWHWNSPRSALVALVDSSSEDL